MNIRRPGSQSKLYQTHFRLSESSPETLQRMHSGPLKPPWGSPRQTPCEFQSGYFFNEKLQFCTHISRLFTKSTTTVASQTSPCHRLHTYSYDFTNLTNCSHFKDLPRTPFEDVPGTLPDPPWTIQDPPEPPGTQSAAPEVMKKMLTSDMDSGNSNPETPQI